MCFALDIPLLSVPTMELLARQVTSEADKIVAIVDARRMEVYTTVYSSDYHEITPTHAKILEEDAYEEIASEKLVFVGSGAEKLQKLKEFKSATYLPDAKPTALEMTIPALNRYKKQKREDKAYHEPYYLKDYKQTQHEK